MKIINKIREMQQLSRQWRGNDRRIGLVPTMGALHEGHFSLIRKSLEKTDITIVSIFVNPTQFGENEDFNQYPRDFSRDRNSCAEMGVAAVFHPPNQEMYGPDFSTWITEEKLSRPWCGSARPGHFRGVATIVGKLFNATLPDLAVFGQKDAQQALVIKRLVRDLNFPIEISIAPIIREEDGLAKSSRNNYLNEDERARAVAIYRGLTMIRQLYEAGEKNTQILTDKVKREIAAAEGSLEYAEIRDQRTLELLTQIDRPAILAVAAYFGSTRLIDNCFLP